MLFGDPGMTFDEKIRKWSVQNPSDGEDGGLASEANEDGTSELDNQSLSNDDLNKIDDEKPSENEEAGHETILGEQDRARIDFAVNTSSFSWFLKAVQSRSQLDYSSAGVLDLTRETASSILSQYRGNRALRPQQISIRMAWNPQLFVQQQEYDGIHSLFTALAITGTTMKAQLSSCSDYLNQVWPLTGEAVLGAIIAAAKTGEVPATTTLFDGMQLSIELVEGSLRAKCVGLLESIIDVVEVLAWIGSALRESLIPDKMMYSTTSLRIHQKAVLKDSSAELLLNFAEEELPVSDMPHIATGGCWLNGLLRNPVISKGFPTPIRPEGTPGLEMPLKAMALLVNAPHLILFNNRALLKGFNAAAIPTSYTDSVIRWHFIMSEDGGRLQYGDDRITESPQVSSTLATTQIQMARHILGWTSSAAYNVGKVNPGFAVQLVFNEWREPVLTTSFRFSVS